MSDEKLEIGEVISILSTALLHVIDIGSKGRIHKCTSIGFVHSTVSKDKGSIKTWLIKFNPETCAFSIDSIETDKFPEGTLLYWHEDNEDAVTQAALFSDDIVKDDVT